jgi:hypothetical protein
MTDGMHIIELLKDFDPATAEFIEQKNSVGQLFLNAYQLIRNKFPNCDSYINLEKSGVRKLRFGIKDPKEPRGHPVFSMSISGGNVHFWRNKYLFKEGTEKIQLEPSFSELNNYLDDSLNLVPDLELRMTGDGLTSIKAKSSNSGFNQDLSIWKVSHSPSVLSAEHREWLADNCYITVHKNTGNGSIPCFEQMVEGDIVSLGYGNTVFKMVRVTSKILNVSDSPLTDEWLLRRYEEVKSLAEPIDYKGEHKRWSPRYPGTCWGVPKKEFLLFEQEILKPYFNIDLSVFGLDIPQEQIAIGKATMTNGPLNQIYYGPPGTGKTFKLQNILKEQYTDNAVIQDRNVWLSNQIDSLNWFEILVLVLLDADTPINVPNIISHEYFQIKAELNNRSANLKQTAWAALQTHTIADSKTVKYSKRVEPLVFDKTQNSLWFINDNEDEQLEEYSSLLASLKEGPKQVETIKRFEFVTFHQSYGYEEFIEGLRPITNDNGDISYEVTPGVFKRLCKRAEADETQKYALVIDEINRGNISKIFGELISLIEVDKREGCDHALSVTLPYSGLPFSVPRNVDIIGSMNTADRSLTHIDVALRRRFEFKELRTNYSLIESDVEGINIRHMLYAMNQRIELLLDREHILGHALLMKVRTLTGLESAFKSSIMPLLEEYFFEDWGQINQVLNSNGFIEEQQDARSTWLGSEDEYAAKSYKVNFNALSKVEKYQQIYKSVDAAAFIDCDAG